MSTERPPEPAEHFESFERQEHAARLGMWIFLASETLLFGGLFGLYVAYRAMYPHAFVEASHHNYMTIGTINTAVLITSSFFVAWAVHSTRSGRRGPTIFCLWMTFALGVMFLGLKTLEYSLHFKDGIYPGEHYAFAQMPSAGAKMFFTLYYFLTGLHALHVVAGMTIIAWLAVRAHRHKMSAARHTELELGGLYWHLVDIVWIFLWPMLYLAG